MGREIFFKIFDGLQNIFFYPIFVISFLSYEVRVQNIQTSYQGGLRKARHVKQITSTQQI